MENTNNNNKQQQQQPSQGQGYDPTARDFQRTEEETDNISQSEVDAQKNDEKKRTEQANTTPNKNNVW